MEIASHMQKVARLHAIHQRLDAKTDFELWYWMALDAGNQAINAALHAEGVTAQTPELASQVNDVYMRPNDGGQFEAVVKRGGDIIHPQMSEFDKPLSSELRDAIAALATLEHYRDPCIRLGRDVTDQIIDECAEAYAQVLRITREIVTQSKPQQ